MAKRNLRNMGQITSKLNMQYAIGKYLQEEKKSFENISIKACMWEL
jgi:hypothetical protein